MEILVFETAKAIDLLRRSAFKPQEAQLIIDALKASAPPSAITQGDVKEIAMAISSMETTVEDLSTAVKDLERSLNETRNAHDNGAIIQAIVIVSAIAMVLLAMVIAL